MASLINKFFHQAPGNEQSVLNSLKSEAIKVAGRTYYYLPRTVMKQDLILGEDVLSKFESAIPIEMYMADNEGFAGDREMFSKFGLEIRNSYKLIISVERWEREIKPSVTAAFAPNRPQEGDLIYDPLTMFLMEIKFVDHDADFFQVGKNYLYHLSCEAFQYSSEDIATGIADIDLFDENSLDTLDTVYVLENGKYLYTEGGVQIDFESPKAPFTDYGVDTNLQVVNITHSFKDPFA